MVYPDEYEIKYINYGVVREDNRYKLYFKNKFIFESYHQIFVENNTNVLYVNLGNHTFNLDDDNFF